MSKRCWAVETSVCVFHRSTPIESKTLEAQKIEFQPQAGSNLERCIMFQNKIMGSYVEVLLYF